MMKKKKKAYEDYSRLMMSVASVHGNVSTSCCLFAATKVTKVKLQNLK